MSQAPARLVPLALVGALFAASCALSVPAGPGGGADGPNRGGEPGAKRGATPAPTGTPAPVGTSAPKPTATTGAPAATPEPLPSLGLLLKGRVTVDTSAFLKAGIAEPTAVGVKLISNNGPGLISDKGVGLIGNNAGGLISNNSGSIVSKTKYGLAQASDRSLRAVQGMLVKAISLRTGELLAGPVATDAEGRYRLGFLAKPESNLKIVAYVNNKEADAAFAYDAFTPPADQPVVSSDANDVLSSYLIRVLAARVQYGIDARKRGEVVEVDEDDAPDEQSRKHSREVNKALATISPEIATILDQNGETARKFAERTVSFADLTNPVYAELAAICEEVRQFDAKLATPPATPTIDEVLRLLGSVKTKGQVPEMLIGRGMAKDVAEALHKRLDATADALNIELSRVGNEHLAEVLFPLLTIEGLGDALMASPSPSPAP